MTRVPLQLHKVLFVHTTVNILDSQPAITFALFINPQFKIPRLRCNTMYQTKTGYSENMQVVHVPSQNPVVPGPVQSYGVILHSSVSAHGTLRLNSCVSKYESTLLLGYFGFSVSQLNNQFIKNVGFHVKN